MMPFAFSLSCIERSSVLNMPNSRTINLVWFYKIVKTYEGEPLKAVCAIKSDESTTFY